MRILPFLVLLLLVSGCIQKQGQPNKPDNPLVIEEPKPVVQTPTAVSVLSSSGFKFPYSPVSSSWSVETSHTVDRCTADLTQTAGTCAEEKNEDGRTKTLTWCENNTKYTITSSCYYDTVEGLRTRLLSTKETVVSTVNLYSPATINRLTWIVDENYDWGEIRFVYTTHARYPVIQKSMYINDKQVFCEDSSCSTIIVFLDGPAKYVIIHTPSFSDTKTRATEFVSSNFNRVYQTSLKDAFKLFSGQFAYNHGVMACVNKLGLMRAEPAYFNPSTYELVSDRAKNLKVYAPLSFFYNADFWKTPQVIGSQIDLFTHEFARAEREGYSYKVCSSGAMPQCYPACANGNALAVGECPQAGDIPLAEEIDEAVDVFNRLFEFTSLGTTSCFTLLNHLGEDSVVGDGKTGQGMIVSRLEKADPTLLMIFKGPVDSTVLKSTIDKKYSFRFNLVYEKTVSNCDLYSYEYGQGLICVYPKTSVAIYNYCSPKDKCSAVMDDLLNRLALPW